MAKTSLDEAGFPPRWNDMAELERLADEWVGRLRRERERIARNNGGLQRLAEWLDRRLRTERVEHLDEPDFPAVKKLKMVQALHRMNQLVRSYHHFLEILEPILRRAAREQGRPARMLELACGSGEFTLALTRLARKKKLPVEITGSDYIPEYVESAKREAERRRVPALFRVVNAFDMHNVDPGAYDVVFITQSLHHFSPGQLAMMVAQSCRRVTTAFVGVDGFRSVPLLVMVPGIATLAMRSYMFHDAWVTARKLYPASELELIGRLAAPDARVAVERFRKRFSVLRVEHEE